MDIWHQMMLFRFIMGMGVGGEYPMASTITSESSSNNDRIRNLAAVFSMQGVGRVLCALMLLISAFTITDTHWQWRFAILMGALPMLIAVYFRFKAEETEAYQHQVKEKITTPMDRFRNICSHVWDNRVKLAGTAGSWFILDILFYGNSLFSADVTRAMGTENNLQSKTVQNLYIQLMAMPGYILAVIFMEKIGMKNLQLIGFAGEGIIFLAMAIFQQQFKGLPALFVVMYALTFFFDDVCARVCVCVYVFSVSEKGVIGERANFERDPPSMSFLMKKPKKLSYSLTHLYIYTHTHTQFGPNTSTFVIPAVIYPTEIRSTCHG
jgi:PHS family inorganic phosphate transporter-like MFS transporter